MSQDFPCPKCSEPIRPGMLRCRECGTTLNVERRGLIKEKTPATEPSDDATRNRDAIVNLSVREEAYLVNEQSADQVAYQLYRDGSPASDDEIEIEFAALPESNDPTVDERTDETNPVEGGQKPGRDVTRMLRKPPYSIVAGSALTLSLLTAFYGSFHRRPSDLPSSQGPQQPRQEVAGPEEPVANRNDAMPDKVPARQLDTVENQPTVATGDAPNQVPAHKTIADPVVEPESAPVDRATMLKRAGQAVVVIRVLKSDGETATGSGFLCRDRQTIVANFHVLKDAVSASVEFENGQRTTVFGFESALPGLDLVVLRLNDPAIDVDPLPLAEKLPTQGETVFAFGSPRGLQGTVSTSTVSATRTFEECSRHVEQATGRKLPFEFKPDSQWIQTALTMSSEAGGGTIDAEPALSFALHSTELKMALPAEPRMPQLLASLPNTNVKVESPKNADEWKATEALLTKLEDQRQELLQKKEQLNEDRETLQQRVKAVEADLAVLVPKLKAEGNLFEECCREAVLSAATCVVADGIRNHAGVNWDGPQGSLAVAGRTVRSGPAV